MLEFLLSYTGLFLISLFLVCCYLFAITLFHFLYTKVSQKPHGPMVHSSPPKIILQHHHREETPSPYFRNESPLILDTPSLINIEETENESFFESPINPYLLTGFYELILLEKIHISHPDLFEIISYHMRQDYFHDLLRIRKDEAPKFDEKLNQTLEKLKQSSCENPEVIRNMYQLFKSSTHKSLDYGKQIPQSRSLFE